MVKCVLLLSMAGLEIVNLTKEPIFPVVSVEHIGFCLAFVTELYYLICYVVGYQGHFYRLAELLFKVSWNLNLFFYISSKFQKPPFIVSKMVGPFTNIQLREFMMLIPVATSLLEMGAKKLRYDDFDVVWTLVGTFASYFIGNMKDLEQLFEDERKIQSKLLSFCISGVAMLALHFGVERYNGVPINPDPEPLLNGNINVNNLPIVEVAEAVQPVTLFENEPNGGQKDNGMKIRTRSVRNNRYH